VFWIGVVGCLDRCRLGEKTGEQGHCFASLLAWVRLHGDARNRVKIAPEPIVLSMKEEVG